MKFVVVLLFIILLLIIALFIPAVIEINASLGGKNNIRIYWLGIKLNKKRREEKQKKNSFKKLFKNRSLKEALNSAADILCTLFKKARFVIKRVRIEQFRLYIKVASDDAALTAIEYGAVCGIVYPALSLIADNKKGIDENINISCDYNSESPQLEFYLKASLRLIYLLTILGLLPKIISALVKKEN